MTHDADPRVLGIHFPCLALSSICCTSEPRTGPWYPRILTFLEFLLEVPGSLDLLPSSPSQASSSLRQDVAQPR